MRRGLVCSSLLASALVSLAPSPARADDPAAIDARDAFVRDQRMFAFDTSAAFVMAARR